MCACACIVLTLDGTACLFHLRNLQTMLESGQVLPMHSHPRPHLRYTFSPGVQKHTWKDGSETIQIDKVGAYEWRDELEHRVDNVGSADIHSLVFEFNQLGVSVVISFRRRHFKKSRDRQGVCVPVRARVCVCVSSLAWCVHSETSR